MGPLLPTWLFAAALLSPAHSASEPVTVGYVPLTFYPANDEPGDVGCLRFRAGFQLTADHQDFGGFSGMAVSADGRWLTAVSDRGRWLVAELRHTADGTLRGLGQAHLGPLRDFDGKPVTGEERRDAEELAVLPDREFLVSFEGHHRFVVVATDGRIPPSLSSTPRPLPHPAEIAGADSNAGMEAVTRLDDGRLLVLSEDLRTNQGRLIGWVGTTGDESWQRLTLTPTETFRPTSVTTLPAGDVLLLERSYCEETGVVRARLSLIGTAEIVPGAELESREIARLEPPQPVDNMEAVAARSGPAGETLIYLLSDDNFSADQQTVLLQFELRGDGRRR